MDEFHVSVILPQKLRYNLREEITPYLPQASMCMLTQGYMRPHRHINTHICKGRPNSKPLVLTFPRYTANICLRITNMALANSPYGLSEMSVLWLGFARSDCQPPQVHLRFQLHDNKKGKTRLWNGSVTERSQSQFTCQDPGLHH